MNEKGFMIGKLQKTKRIFNLEHYASGKLRGSREDGNREWITLLACIYAENQILKHQVAGYEDVLKYKERRKKKGKPLFEL